MAIFSDRSIEMLYKRFCKQVEIVARNLNISTDKISISETEFSAAIYEANTDLEFVMKRRNIGGPSAGKVAGVVTFRLCRHHIVNIEAPASDVPEVELIQDSAILSLVTAKILKIRMEEPCFTGKLEDAKINRVNNTQNTFPNLKKEILYLLKKRHYNQESLGILFDSMRITEAVKAA